MPSRFRLFAGLLVAFLLVVGLAKTAGQIGEQPDGYLGIVNASTPPAVRQMAEEINLKRREEYRAIASKNATNLQAVEALTGKMLVERASGGQYVRLPDGRWVRK